MKHDSKKALIIYLSFLAIVSLITDKTWAQQDRLNSQKTPMQHTVVRIQNITGLHPQTLIIKRGTTVIWLNQSPGEIKITFTARQVTQACKSPSNFIITKDQVFTSNDIPHGAVASLCFIRQGGYDYVVEIKKEQPGSLLLQPAALTGKVIVE